MIETKRTIQQYLDLLLNFCDNWGLAVNVEKTTFQYFTKKQINIPVLRYNHRPLRYVRQHRVLGMILDAPRLRWGPHITALRSDALKRIGIMKHLASPNWGASAKFLRTFYLAYIRAKVDYGSSLYAAASPNLLKTLDVIQNTCLRLILGARKTSPIISLQVEARVPPLSLRRKYLGAQWHLKIMYRPRGDITAEIQSHGPEVDTSALAAGAGLLQLFGEPRCRRSHQAQVDPILSLVSYTT